MRVVRHLMAGARPFVSPVVALGNFDGLHLGHLEILGRARGLAEKLEGDAVAFTFMPHPVSVLAPHRAPPLVTSLAERLRRLRMAGVDGVFVQRFTRAFAALSPADFVRRFILEGLGASAVVVGFDVTFGRDRAGTPEVLRDLGQSMGFVVEVVPPQECDGLKVSSSAVRRALASGEVHRAAELLGRPHELHGRVRHGDHRGATIGFPTANLFPCGGMLPPDGVYAVLVEIESQPGRFAGVANLGTNPTFGARQRRLETHLFDYEGDLYGRRLRVGLVRHLRGELKFDGVDRLVAQIRADARAAREILASGS